MVTFHVIKIGMYRIKAMNISSSNVHRILKDGCAVLQEENCPVSHQRISGIPRNFFQGGYARNFFHQIQLRTEGRQNGDLGAEAS
jgi:hypothetical protein